MSRLEGRAVLIAGGAGGIGWATAQRLSSEGARVMIGDIDEDAATQRVEELRAAGSDAYACGFDIADERSCAALVGDAVKRFGRLDGVFNVAADMSRPVIGRDTDVVDIPLDVWHRSIDVDLTGTFYMCRNAIPALLESGGGAIVNTLSGLAFYSNERRPAYTAAKAGVGALTRHIAIRWGKAGIVCNAVAPGLVVTEGSSNVGQPERDAVLETMTTTRLGRPQDVAAMAALLLSSDGEWINGHVHFVDGGRR